MIFRQTGYVQEKIPTRQAGRESYWNDQNIIKFYGLLSKIEWDAFRAPQSLLIEVNQSDVIHLGLTNK